MPIWRKDLAKIFVTSENYFIFSLIRFSDWHQWDGSTRYTTSWIQPNEIARRVKKIKKMKGSFDNLNFHYYFLYNETKLYSFIFS